MFEKFVKILFPQQFQLVECFFFGLAHHAVHILTITRLKIKKKTTTTKTKKKTNKLLKLAKSTQNLARSLLSPKLQMSLRITKPTKWSVRPAKTQVSLVIRPVWSESSLSAWRIIGSFCYPKSTQKDSGRMPRLIWVFARRTTTLLVLSCCDSNQWFYTTIISIRPPTLRCQF